MVEVDKPNKGLDLFLVPWYGPFCYARNLDWIHLHQAFCLIQSLQATLSVSAQTHISPV